MTGSSDIPSFETMRRIAQFSDIQRLLRKDPRIRDDLMSGLAKKVVRGLHAVTLTSAPTVGARIRDAASQSDWSGPNSEQSSTTPPPQRYLRRRIQSALSFRPPIRSGFTLQNDSINDTQRTTL